MHIEGSALLVVESGLIVGPNIYVFPNGDEKGMPLLCVARENYMSLSAKCFMQYMNLREETPINCEFLIGPMCILLASFASLSGLCIF